jgi:hypothetical protein
MLPDKEFFNYKECIIAGDPCWLITPKELGVVWTDDNYRYRSAIVLQTTGEIISSGWVKFVNFGEQPDFQPWNDKWHVRGTFKHDGSLVICSIYKNEFICRTRGTTSVLQLPTGKEILDLVEKHKVEETLREYHGSGVSYLFEYISPNHIIVLRECNQPTLILLGAIHHQDGYICSRNFISNIAEDMDVALPMVYEWNSIAECITDVQAWESKEGVVLQSPDGQILKKIKSDSYKRLHSLMFGMKSINSVLGVFMDVKTPKYSEFRNYIESTIDFEVAENCKDHILTITKAYTKVLEKIDKVRNFVNTLPRDFNRKEQAEAILYNFRDWRKSAAFTILDKRQFDDKFIKQVIQYEIDKQ